MHACARLCPRTIFLPCSAPLLKALPHACQNGATALIMASQNGHIDVVKLLLLDKGADVNSADKVSVPARGQRR